MLETVLRRIALTCAVLLLFALKGDCTTWVWGGGQTVTDGAIYNLVGTACGILALAGLAVALNACARLVVPLLAFLVAIGAFVLAGLVAGVSVWAQARGLLWFYSAASQYTSPLGDFAGSTFGSARKVSPARAPYVFTGVAMVGTVATLGLALVWLASDRDARAADAIW